MPRDTPVPYEDVHALTMAVLRTGAMLGDLLADLLDALPEDAFPGERHAEVLVEMVSGTIAPVVDAAGLRAARDATALLGAVSDKVLTDLAAAVELARQGPGARDPTTRERCAGGRPRGGGPARARPGA
jgi:hypothetical protein